MSEHCRIVKALAALSVVASHIESVRPAVALVSQRADSEIQDVQGNLANRLEQILYDYTAPVWEELSEDVHTVCVMAGVANRPTLPINAVES